MSTDQYQLALKDRTIAFEVKNNGTHLIVEGTQGFIDVWPTTGKWICRYTKKEGFGLRELLLYITQGKTLEVHVFKPTVKLELNHSTALWLKGVVQNPLWSSPEAEPEEDSVARAEVWNALGKVQL